MIMSSVLLSLRGSLFFASCIIVPLSLVTSAEFIMSNLATINQTIFDALKENMEDLLPILIEAFVEDSLILLQEMKQGIRDKNAMVVATVVHTLKSSAKNIGADQLSRYCSDMEKRLESIEEGFEAEYFQMLYQLASNEMDKVIALLKKSPEEVY